MVNPNYVNAVSRAGEVLERFDITDAPVPVESIAKSLGFEVLIASFEDEGIAGYVQVEPKKQIILSRRDAPTRRAFTVAHEIGHVELHLDQLKGDANMGVLYRKPIGGEKDPVEKEANCFAGALLVPDFLIAKYHSYDLTLAQLASIFGVSSEVMHYRLKHTGHR